MDSNNNLVSRVSHLEEYRGRNRHIEECFYEGVLYFSLFQAVLPHFFLSLSTTESLEQANYISGKL